MSGRGCSSWPTPRVGETSDQASYPGNRFSLSAMVGQGKWPTPSAALTNDQESPETFAARQEALKAKGINGNGAGTPLTMAVKMWPTAISSQGKQGADRRNRKQGATLPTAIRDADLWPTPEGIRDAKSLGTRALLERRQGESARGQPLVEVACHWPSPQARGADNRGADPARLEQPGRHGGYNLDDWAAAWPTPTDGDAKASGSRNTEASNAHFGVSLTDVALGTMGQSRSSRKKSLSSRQDPETSVHGRRSLNDQERSARPSLNPNFVEWLMGWPPGWTDCGSPVTGWCHWLQRQRTALCELSWNYEPAQGAEPEPMQMELLP